MAFTAWQTTEGCGDENTFLPCFVKFISDVTPHANLQIIAGERKASRPVCPLLALAVAANAAVLLNTILAAAQRPEERGQCFFHALPSCPL